MRYPFTLILLCLLTAGYAQDSRPVLVRDTLVNIKEYNWTFPVPAGYSVMNQTQLNTMSEKGKKVLENANSMEFDVSTTKTLFGFAKGYNTFTANSTPYSKEDGNYEEGTKMAQKLAFNALQQQLGEKVTIDSSSSTTEFGERRFIQFKMVVKINPSVTITALMLSRLFKDNDVTVTVAYMNDTVRKEMEGILASFTFK